MFLKDGNEIYEEHLWDFQRLLYPKWFTHSVMSDSCDPMDCSPPGSSVHGIFQARILGGLPCAPPGHLPNPGIEPISYVSCIGRQILNTSTTWEAHL